jgi:hypothetical protein
MPITGHPLGGVPFPSSSYLSQFDSTKRARTRTDEIGALKPREGFTFGCDPEQFVFDADGRAVAPDMIPGTKEEPHKVKCGAIQRDGMAAEFNIEPAKDFQTWNSNIETVMKELKSFLPEGYELRPIPSVVFDKDVFDAAPDDYKPLGCSPDWNAWEQDLNPPPYCEDNPYLRTASGHIHIGWGENYDLNDPQHIQNCFDLVKQLDWHVGGWSLKVDSDPTRRKLYGKAGACRLKPYGVEYRVLGPFWLLNKNRRLAVWNRMQMAIHEMQNRFLPEKFRPEYNAALIESINSGVADSKLFKECRYPLQISDSSYAIV